MTTRRKALFWIEIVGLLPATLIFGPLLWAGLFGMGLVIQQELFGKAVPPAGRFTGLGEVLLLVLTIVSAMLGLAAAWATLLGGSRNLRQNAGLRWLARISLVLGLSSAAYMLVSMLGPTADFQGRIDWLILLPPAMLVGGHQLYGLSKAAPPPDIAA